MYLIALNRCVLIINDRFSMFFALRPKIVAFGVGKYDATGMNVRRVFCSDAFQVLLLRSLSVWRREFESTLRNVLFFARKTQLQHDSENVVVAHPASMDIADESGANLMKTDKLVHDLGNLPRCRMDSDGAKSFAATL